MWVGTREEKSITRNKIVDPSWFNGPALPVAMADTIVPDFPLADHPIIQRILGA